MTLTRNEATQIHVADHAVADRVTAHQSHHPRTMGRGDGRRSSSNADTHSYGREEMALQTPDADRRIQRREFKDYQPLFMLINSLDFVDAAIRREFMCIHGPVWQRYNETTRRARERRITALFLSDDNNFFHELLFVGCDALKGCEHHCRVMWMHPTWAMDEESARNACITLGGRSVLRWSNLFPKPHPI
jgi:hypothetical protein